MLIGFDMFLMKNMTFFSKLVFLLLLQHHCLINLLSIGFLFPIILCFLFVTVANESTSTLPVASTYVDHPTVSRAASPALSPPPTEDNTVTSVVSPPEAPAEYFSAPFF